MDTQIILAALIMPTALIVIGVWAMFCGHRHDRDNRRD